MAGMLPELITPVPGPESLRLAGELREVECRNITWLAEDFPVFWERAEGANVWDADGNRYLDLTSGFGVATAGFGNEIVVNADGIIPFSGWNRNRSGNRCGASNE